jgi:hypothetical protein
MSNIDKALLLKAYTNLATKVPLNYSNLLYVFFRVEANKLLERQLYNYKIKLIDSKQPRFSLLYSMF